LGENEEIPMQKVETNTFIEIVDAQTLEVLHSFGVVVYLTER
jgi:hypothetical protein